MHNHPAPRRPQDAFTLIELLVVISIIAILASLAIPAVQGAIKSARKGEARAMANQIKLAITAFNAEYGTFPTNTNSDTEFLKLMTGDASATNNPRQIRFLEIPPKATNSSGLVTPSGLYAKGTRKTYNIITDTNFDGKIKIPGQDGEINMSVAVYVEESDTNSSGGKVKYIGTW